MFYNKMRMENNHLKEPGHKIPLTPRRLHPYSLRKFNENQNRCSLHEYQSGD